LLPRLAVGDGVNWSLTACAFTSFAMEWRGQVSSLPRGLQMRMLDPLDLIGRERPALRGDLGVQAGAT
jgi:hypothetical protein